VIIVALDTATSAVTSGVVELRDAAPERPVELAATYTLDARAHAELLAPQVLGCLAAAGLSAADIDAVVVGRGPGPFTGLRVGMAFAAGYADALGVPCRHVHTHDAIALGARWELGAGETDAPALLVCTDARRREAYFSRYDAAGQRIEGPAVRAAAEIEPPAGGGREIALGDPVRLAELPEGFDVRDDLRAFPQVAALAACAAPALLSGAEPEPGEPLYLRRPDAVPPRPQQISPALTGHDDAR